MDDAFAKPEFESVAAAPEHRTMELRGIGVLSAARLMGGFYGGLMLVFGGLYGAFAIVGSVIGAAVQGEPSLLVGAVIGVAFAVLMPLIYGLFGALGGLLMAALYNFVAGRFGGLELRFAAPSP